MRQDLNGATHRQSGDLNLVAAMMSQGVSLDRLRPVSIVESDRGKYGSFKFADASDDGTISSDLLMNAWSGVDELPVDHGFTVVCDFIRSRPRGIQRTDDLFDHAIKYLRDLGHALPGLVRVADIPNFVKALPQNEASYILAYVWNREICFTLYSNARRMVYMTEGTGKDMRHAILDSKLPRWQSRELLSRLQG